LTWRYQYVVGLDVTMCYALTMAIGNSFYNSREQPSCVRLCKATRGLPLHVSSQ
jgi:hypothetical protein